MNPIVDKLLSQVYELEGLLLVVDRHKGDISPFIYEMIQKKAERIGELAPMFTPEAVNKWANQRKNTPLTINENEQSVANDEINEPTTSETIETPQETAHIQDTNLDEYNDMASDEDFTEENDNFTEIQEDIFNENSTPVNDTPMETSPEEDIYNEDIEEFGQTEYDNLTIDDMLQRNISKDLSKAFSLNDRFRYRRELFSNSEVEMRNSLNLVEAMQSFNEAEEYFYGDLEWDKESPEVVDFMTIIKNHFL